MEFMHKINFLIIVLFAGSFFTINASDSLTLRIISIQQYIPVSAIFPTWINSDCGFVPKEKSALKLTAQQTGATTCFLIQIATISQPMATSCMVTVKLQSKWSFICP